MLTNSGGTSIQATYLDDTQVEVILRAVQKSGDYRFTIEKAFAAIAPQTYDLIAEEMCAGRDVAVATLYAQTENGPFISLTEPDCMSRELRRNANGRPLPGVANA